MSEPTVIGPAVDGATRIGTAPKLTLIIDLNGDGVPDWRQPEQVMQLLERVVGMVATLIPDGSPTARVLAPIEAALPLIEAVLGSKK